MKPSKSRQIQGLPLREHQVLWYWMTGYTMETTAMDLGISQSTVKTYRDRLRARFGATTRAEMFAAGRAALARSGPLP